MSMSQSRFNSIFSGMSSAAKKVYEVVPMVDHWNTSKIVAELQRCNIGMDYRVIGGCLNALRQAGLITESSSGEYRREPVRAPITTTQKHKEEEMQPAKTPGKATAKTQLSPLDRLDELAQRTTAMSDMLKKLASDISDAAVEIQDQMDTNEQNVAKLRQLQQLLRSIETTA